MSKRSKLDWNSNVINAKRHSRKKVVCRGTSTHCTISAIKNSNVQNAHTKLLLPDIQIHTCEGSSTFTCEKCRIQTKTKQLLGQHLKNGQNKYKFKQTVTWCTVKRFFLHCTSIYVTYYSNDINFKKQFNHHKMENTNLYVFSYRKYNHISFYVEKTILIKTFNQKIRSVVAKTY